MEQIPTLSASPDLAGSGSSSGMPSSLAARALWKSMEGSWRNTPVRIELRRSLSAWNRGFTYSDCPE
jgi:hypothetical protein